MKWRCLICSEKYCINCNKTFPEECLDSIYCNKCTSWYHLRCTELSKSEFQHLGSTPTENWKCISCINRFCNKCDTSTHNKPKTKCCLCCYTYHLSCVGIPLKTDKSITSGWLCQSCRPTIFPFSSIDDKDVFDLSLHKLEKFSRKNISTTHYSDTCNVCKVKLNKSNPGIPCSNCKCKIHVKCSKLTNANKTRFIHKTINSAQR